MLRGMAAADHDAPGAVTEDELHTIAQGTMAVGQRQDAALIVAAARDRAGAERLRRHADATIHIGNQRMDAIRHTTAPLMAETPFCAGHPHFAFEVRGERIRSMADGVHPLVADMY